MMNAGERPADAEPGASKTPVPPAPTSWPPDVADTVALYDRVAASFQRWWAPVIMPASLHLLDLVQGTVAERPDAVIVDLGSGTGPLARAAVARWPSVRVLAIDPSAGMLEVGRAEAARMLDPSARRRISWLPGVAERLPTADASVDVVVSSFTLQYLRRRAAGLREAHRIMRPGGAIAVVTWLENDWPFEPWRILRELVDELGIVRPASSEVGLFRSLPSAARLLRRAGFRRVRAAEGLVDYQWTLGSLFRCALEAEQRPLFDSLDAATRDRLAGRWRQRLERLGPADLRYRDRVAYVSGQRG
jgi:ubiquinone/menaquinone biosynthesis C-methylase UbiE